ncbi:hypothetical protein B296_00017190 [Ensete ventricosum]|uniref:Uncharacterized protein n=1 Tax=Ensete ventricosum TaxID=4639 RepID=A0A426XI34_ENSVE|nr:hypothetical protein B296_00017190 [Ensete ventricosum]
MISYYYCKTGWGGGWKSQEKSFTWGEGLLVSSSETSKMRELFPKGYSVFPHSHIGTKAKRSPKVLLAVLFGLLEGRISGEDDAEDGQIVQESPPLDELSQLKQEPTTPSGLAGQVWQWDEDEAECFRLWPVMPPAGTIDSIMS